MAATLPESGVVDCHVDLFTLTTVSLGSDDVSKPIYALLLISP